MCVCVYLVYMTHKIRDAREMICISKQTRVTRYILNGPCPRAADGTFTCMYTRLYCSWKCTCIYELYDFFSLSRPRSLSGCIKFTKSARQNVRTYFLVDIGSGRNSGTISPA